MNVDQKYGDIIQKANNVSKCYFEENSNLEKWRHSLRPEGVGFSFFGGKCTRQAFTVNLPAPGQPFPWPDHPSDFQEVITEYFEFLQNCGSVILNAISIGKNDPQDSLTKYLDKPNFSNNHVISSEESCDYSNSVLFIRHYQSENIGENLDARTVWPKDHTREHTDSGILTLKPLSDIAALQIMRWSDGKWVDAEVTDRESNKYPIILLVGEELGFLTNGFFKAAIHRVAFQNSEATRVSLPFQLRGNRKKFDNLDNYSPSLKMIALSFY